MRRFRGFIVGNFVCNLFFSACVVGGLMVHRDRNTIFEIPRPPKADSIVPISQDMLTEFSPILETADTTKEALWKLQKLLSNQDKHKMLISERNLKRSGNDFDAPLEARNTIAATEDLSYVNRVERDEDHLRNLMEYEVGASKNLDIDPVTARYYLTKINDDPEYYKTTSDETSQMVAPPPPDVVEYIRSNVFVQNGGISLNGDRLKRPQHAPCSGKIPCDLNDVTSAESTPHNDVSVQVALQVLTDLVKERADNRRVLARQAAEQAHIDRTLDKLWKMG